MPEGESNQLVVGNEITENNQALQIVRNRFKSGRMKGMFRKPLVIMLGVLVAGGLVLGGVYLFGNREKKLLKPVGTTGNLPEVVVNPITGEQFSGEQAKNWFNIRPLAVMVNNYVDARPQSGLAAADIVYEIVAEGGITRLLPFYQKDIPEKIGPVRSTREYYLVLVKEIGDAMLMHIGWSPQALEAIETWPVRSLGRGNAPFWRENPRNVAVEHTAYVNGRELLAKGMELGWEGTRDFTVWQFKNEKEKYENSQVASKLTVDFWYPGDYTAAFEYDATNNVYKRFMGYDADNKLIPHIDQETGGQLTVKNVIVQFVKETPIPGDTSGRLTYELIGSGTGLVFLDGKVIPVTWSKADRDGRTMFYNTSGEEMMFNRGKFWVCVVPDRNIDQVVYQ